jgi:hypothetical protein
LHQNELKELYNAAGWDAYITGMYGSDQIHWDENDIKAEASPEKIAEYLDQGYVITALVNIEKDSEEKENLGLLMNAEDPDMKEPANHFVNVLAVLENDQGDQFIRVYNPFHNREEVYSWDRFSSAWDNPLTTGRFRAVLAKPSGD